jgi:hypothetical protein
VHQQLWLIGLARGLAVGDNVCHRESLKFDLSKEADCSIHPRNAHAGRNPPDRRRLRTALFFCENTRLAYVDPEL